MEETVEGFEMINVLGKILEQGGYFTLIVLFGWACFKIIMKLIDRLFREAEFDDEGNLKKKAGLIVRIYESWDVFLKGMARRDEQQLNNCNVHARLLNSVKETQECTAHCLRNLVIWAGDSDAPFSTKNFNKTMIDYLRAEILRLEQPKTPEERVRIEEQIRELFKTIIKRHERQLERMEQSKRDHLAQVPSMVIRDPKDSDPEIPGDEIRESLKADCGSCPLNEPEQEDDKS